MKQDMILVLDLGGTENTRVARAVRALGVYSELHPHDIKPEELGDFSSVRGVIACKGKNLLLTGEKPFLGEEIKKSGLPVLELEEVCASDEALAASLAPFVFETCRAEANWNMQNFADDAVAQIRAQVGEGKVLLALSGGVDSSVCAALISRAIGDRLTCVHVNHGLLRQGEPEQVCEVFRNQFPVNLVYIDAVDRFLDLLAGVSDPEQKRKIIGETFIRIFEEEAKKLTGVAFLGQGTIYPDIIESGTKTVKAVKAHHNVGGLPERFDFELVEPIKQLFKDEVRALGRELGLPESMVDRQPFPGPGLGVRCTGAITRDRLEAVRASDAILRAEFERAGLSGKVWQYFTVVPELKSVGVRDGVRCYEWAVVLRAVQTVDAMTAEVADIPQTLIRQITSRILAEVPGVNRVLFDYSPKPCATIEWE